MASHLGRTMAVWYGIAQAAPERFHVDAASADCRRRQAYTLIVAAHPVPSSNSSGQLMPHAAGIRDGAHRRAGPPPAGAFDREPDERF